MQLGGHERVGHRFEVTKFDHHVADPVYLDTLLGKTVHARVRGFATARNIVIPDESSNFLDQVRLDIDIETVARWNHAPTFLAVLDPHFQATQHVADVATLNLDAEQTIETCIAQLHARRLRHMRCVDRIDQRPRLAADYFEQQLGSPLHRNRWQLRVDAALKAVRSVGVHAERPRLAGELDRGEVRGFEKNVARVILHRTVQPAHDSGQRDRAGVVRNQQRAGRALHFALIEQRELLARLGQAHADSTLQLVIIEAMHRLAEFHHDIVGDVDDRADRPQAAAAQLFLHPQRGLGRGIDAADDPTDVARALRRGIEFDGEGFVDALFHAGLGGALQRDRVDRGDLARNA